MKNNLSLSNQPIEPGSLCYVRTARYGYPMAITRDDHLIPQTPWPMYHYDFDDIVIIISSSKDFVEHDVHVQYVLSTKHCSWITTVFGIQSLVKIA